jgi:hypothetical protein
MEEKIKISILCQIYGKLLTEKQYQILDDYYNNDLSLSEIAENNNITRQAVNDVINKGKTKLIEFEEKLLFMEKMLKQEKMVEKILKNLDENEDKLLKKSQIEKIKKQLKQLL